MLFIFVIFHTIWLGKILQMLCILPVSILYLSAIRIMFVKILLTVYMLVGIVWSERNYVRELCPVGFFVIVESPSV